MARKVAGLNQQALAQRANYSTSMVRAVEQGREPGSPAFVAAIARALGIEPEELYGQPYRQTLDDDGGVPPGLTELRTLFAEGRYAASLDPGPPAELAAELAKARSLRHSDRARQGIELTPALLRRLGGAVREATTDSARERGYRQLAQAYANTAQLLYRFGWITLVTQAVDQMENSAERSDDPLLAEAQAAVKGVKLGDKGPFHEILKPMFSNARIFGVDLYEAGLGELAEGYFAELVAGPGAVRATLRKYLNT